MTNHLPRYFRDILTLAEIERGPADIHWKRRSDEIVASGVPTNLHIPGNFPQLLEPGLRKVFHDGLRGAQRRFRAHEIFNVERSTRSKERVQGVGELGTDAFNRFQRTGRVGYDSFAPTWPSELVHRPFAAGLQFDRETIEDNLYLDDGIPRTFTGPVRKQARALALFRELSAAAVFNNAFTDNGVDREGFSVAGPDSVGLCSTAHPVSPADLTTTQSNEFNLALTPANLTAVKLAMQAWTDDRGNPAGVEPDTLIVPTGLAEIAWIINTSERDPFSANNTPNPHKNRWRIIEWSFLTDADAWFMVDYELMREFLVWYERIAPELNAERDFDTFIAKFSVYNRFSRGWEDWRWVAGSNPN